MLYLAALLIVLGVALFVAAPLFELDDGVGRVRGSAELARLEHERALAIQGLRELEFDRQMHKISDEDGAALRAVLEARALSAMSEIDKVAARPAPTPRRSAATVRPSVPNTWSFCPSCGAKVIPDTRFCAQCGAEIALRKHA